MESLQQESTTKLMKQRALNDLYKTLKSLGLSSFYKKLVTEQLLLSPFPEIPLEDPSIAQHIKHYYHKMIERIHYIQSNANYHPDNQENQ